LAGAAIGPFLAVTLSAIGFWIKSITTQRNDRKEFLRRIEISITRSLDDTFKAREKLRFFVSRLRSLMAEIRAVTEHNNFSLDTINYPSMRDIYRDIDIPNFKVKSYYLHNKLLWVDAGIKETNETILAFKSDFAELQRKNELHVILMQQNRTPNPPQQRADYAYNIECFANAVDEFISTSMAQGIEFMTQIKIYNDKMRGRKGFWFLWRHEGTKFKYFRNKAGQKTFARNLDSMDRIDKTIQFDVTNAINKAEERLTRLAQ